MGNIADLVTKMVNSLSPFSKGAYAMVYNPQGSGKVIKRCVKPDKFCPFENHFKSIRDTEENVLKCVQNAVYEFALSQFLISAGVKSVVEMESLGVIYRKEGKKRLKAYLDRHQYDWYFNSNTSIYDPFIIMEKLYGIDLTDERISLTGDQHKKIKERYLRSRKEIEAKGIKIIDSNEDSFWNCFYDPGLDKITFFDLVRWEIKDPLIVKEIEPHIQEAANRIFQNSPF